MSRGNRRKGSPLVIMLGLLLTAAVGLAGFLMYKGKNMSNTEGLPSCSSLTIWSHRGHTDANAQVHQGSCSHTITVLQGQGIRHFDIDVLISTGVTMVAHPAELDPVKASSFLRSPCSETPLKEYIRLMKVIMGPTGFFVSLEPKADWNNDNPAFAQPEELVKSMVDIMEEHELPKQHCGFILDETQWDQLPDELQERIEKVCSSTAYPLPHELPNYASINDIAQLPAHYRVLMPSREHFGGFDQPSPFLEQHATTFNVLWVVDDFLKLRRALQLPNVHGVISNNPLKLVKDYKSICGTKYKVPMKLI